MHYLLKETLKLNQSQASDGWLTQDSLWLMSKTASDKLRAHLLSQGIEGIPASNTALFDLLRDHGMALPTPDGKAIWKAAVTGDNGWSHSFTFLRLSPALIWETSEERPPPFAGTVMVVADDGSGSDEASDAPPESPAPAPVTEVPVAETSPNVSGVECLLEMLYRPQSIGH